MFELIKEFFIGSTAHAHVRYIATDDHVQNLSGSDWSYLFSPLIDGHYALMMFVTIMIVLLLGYLSFKNETVRNYLNHIRDRAISYKDLLPWLIRLPLGIALLGFGTSQVLLTPVLGTSSLFGLLQTVIGFLLLTGFLLPLAATAVIILFFFALFQDIYLIGSLDILALALSLLIIDSRRPGVDHLLNLFEVTFVRLTKFIPTILRISFGVGLAYLALYEKILNPRLSEVVVQMTGLQNIIPVSEAMWVFSAGMIELAIGVFLVLGLFTRATAAVTFFVLSLSFFYFGEEVTSHITLFGTLAVLFVTSGGPWSLDSLIRKRPHVLVHEHE